MAFLESTGGDRRLEQAARFTSELGWKIFLDRYTLKDIERGFQVGDLAIVMVEPHPKWPKKDIGIVREVHTDDTISVELLTGPQKGDTLVRKLIDCDRPLETTLDEVAARIARGVAAVEAPNVRDDVVRSFEEEVAHLRFVPGGRIWAGAGTSQNLTFFNCYVLPNPRDSREGIVETLGQMIEIMSRGGGVGINVSSLRPSRAPVRGVNGRSSGAVSWMDLYSRATGLVEQGGCFGPDERIATDRGLIPAQELARRITAGETFSALTHVGPRPITARFVNGEKQLYEVVTARGFRLEVTQEHRVGVLRSGEITTVPLEQLSNGDEILTLLGDGVTSAPIPLKPVSYVRSKMSTMLNEDVTFPETLEPELAYVLGYMHGDGYVHVGKKVSWRANKAFKLATADSRPEIRGRLIDYIRKIWEIEPQVEVGDGACHNIAVHSRLIMDWLEQNSLLKAHSEGVRVPEAIFRAGTVVAGAFVAGYFDADGSDRMGKGGYGFDSVSLLMLRDVQQLLAVNGVAAHIHTTDRSALGWRNIHRLSVTGAEFKERFVDFASMSLKITRTPGYRNHGNNYPRDVWPASGIGGLYYQGLWDATKDRISYRALPRIRARLEADQLQTQVAVLDRLLHVLPDTIVSVLPTRVTTTYDFEVADVHMLSGSGVYTSNSRRGALMLQIEDWHPDLWRFIEVKKTPGMVENANISIRVSDRFMDAVNADGDWQLMFPDTRDAEYDQLWTGDLEEWQALSKPVVVYETTKARKIWHEIIKGAWEAAEPGIVFDERHEKESNSWYFNKLVCTNPCAEQPLPNFGVCTLGHINLAAFYDADHNEVDWTGLKKTVRMGVRFLDDIVDATPYFFDQNRENQQRERRIGMGTLGLGELLIRLGLRYGSPESIAFIDRLYQFIATEAYIYDADLAREKGPFPAFEAEKYLDSGFMKKMPENVRKAVAANGTRNVTIL
ncbi:MAG: LAGLIDADG family homing endonuclease, partial [Clostridia bacterium]